MAEKKTEKQRAATKSAIYNRLAEATGLSKKQVAEFFDELTKVVKTELSKKGPGQMTIPGLLKLRRATKKATPARKGRNPQTGEEIEIKAKPARTVVRVRALKVLQEMVK
jgi:nucleoid DNA-binding protein